MTTQTLTIPILLCNLALALPSEQPLCASSRNYGFDFDEDEIGRELLAPLPVNLSTQPIPEVKADEFEQAFHTFLS